MAKKIMVDAGHLGGYNKPPNYPQYCEGDRMWKLSQYLVSALKAYGFTVGQTKTSLNGFPKKADGSDDVYARGQKAKNYDLLLSLHSNACGTESVNRAVIIQPIDGKQTDLANKIGACVKAEMGVSSYQILQRDYDTGKFYYDNKAHSGKDYYGVIRGAAVVGVPALIIEHGFHTNNAVAKWLMSDANLKSLADAEAKAIADYYGVEKSIYRVQVGAYGVKENAQRMLDMLKSSGFTGIIVRVNDLYRVQVGAFSVKENADAMQQKLKAAGFTGFVRKV